MTIKIKADVVLVTYEDPEMGGCNYCVFDTNAQLCEQINRTNPCGFGHYVLVNGNIKDKNETILLL